MTYIHKSVMPIETIDYLNCKPGSIVIDCTLGGGGHAREIIKKISPGGTLIGIDQDKDAIDFSAGHLIDKTVNIHLCHVNFVDISQVLFELGMKRLTVFWLIWEYH